MRLLKGIFEVRYNGYCILDVRYSLLEAGEAGKIGIDGGKFQLIRGEDCFSVECAPALRACALCVWGMSGMGRGRCDAL